MIPEYPQFDLHQLGLVTRAIRQGERLVAGHYRIPMLPSKHYPYEVVTLTDLQGPERAESAFAHLVVYERVRPSETEHLYRICLQDDIILRRVVGEGDAWLQALLVYILTHELIHISRLSRLDLENPTDEERALEEETVHRLTRDVLAPETSVPLDKVADLYHLNLLP